jgi:hypothetical protein
LRFLNGFLQSTHCGVVIGEAAILVEIFQLR